MKQSLFWGECILFCIFISCTTIDTTIANLASGMAAYQSDFKGYFDMAHLVTDGRKDTQWTSPFVDNEWMYVDLGKGYDIDNIIIYWGENYGEEYTLLVSSDTRAWQEIFHQKNGRGGKERIAFPTTTARYVKFQGIKGKPNPGFMITEMEIYGESIKESIVKTMTLDHTLKEGTLYLNKRWTLRNASDSMSEGKVHSAAGYNDKDWFPAVVPGTVLTTYIENGSVPDLYYGNQQYFISEFFSQTAFWYRTEFNLPEAFNGKNVWLNVDGINYKAEIFVNGEKTGEIKGAFIRGCFDITPFARSDKTNALAVLIHPVENPGIPSIQDLTTPGANGGMLTRDGPTFICSAGWDWIPTIPDRNIGIWQPVYISTSGPVTIKDPFVITDLPLPDTSQADLTVKTYIISHAEIQQKGTIKGQIDDVNFEKEVTLAPGQKKEIVFRSSEFPQLLLKNPKLWWPNTYGGQPLYTLNLEFLTEDGSVSHRISRRFGVREFSYEFPHELVIAVNGVPVFIKGGNWGIDEGMKRTNPERFRACMRLHKEAHFTMIRNWAGQTTQEEFYRLCDEYGFLVWNDFWLANASDGPDPLDNELFITNAIDTIKRFRYHTCIAVWCARNETLPPPVLDDALKNAIGEFDGTRIYLSSSDRSGVHGHGPYAYVDSKDYFELDARGFSTEIGMPAIPTGESMRAMMPEENLWEINPMWGVHDYTNGNVKAYRFGAGIRKRYGDPVDFEDFNRKARMLMMENYRAIFEAWGSKMWKETGGILLWMSNPAWPSLVFQIYDYYLESFAAYFAVKKGCEPLHILWNNHDDTIHVVNATQKTFTDLIAKVELYSISGEKAAEKEVSLHMEANSSKEIFPLPLPKKISDVHFLKLVLKSKDNTQTILSDNFYWRSKDGGDFTSLDELAKISLEGKARRDDGIMTITLENRTDTFALMARLKVTEEDGERRILPVYYSDNYVSLLPGENRTINIDGIPADKTSRVFIDGWNIKPGEIKIE